MKKIKSTRRPGPREGLVLRPSRVRMFLIYSVLFAMAMGVGFLIRFIFSPDSFQNIDWATMGIVAVGGGAVMSFFEHQRWVLRVRDNGELLEGTTGAFGSRVTIPIKSIDWELTRRSLRSWLKIGNSIYVTRMQRVMVSPWFFNPGDFERFLKEIGYTTPE